MAAAQIDVFRTARHQVDGCGDRVGRDIGTDNTDCKPSRGEEDRSTIPPLRENVCRIPEITAVQDLARRGSCNTKERDHDERDRNDDQLDVLCFRTLGVTSKVGDVYPEGTVVRTLWRYIPIGSQRRIESVHEGPTKCRTRDSRLLFSNWTVGKTTDRAHRPELTENGGGTST